MATSFDLIVVGGGPGGYVAAIRAAQLGMKVGCIEKEAALGGVCLRVGCIPSKAMLDSSEHFHMAQTSFETHGIGVSGLKLDLSRMLKRKEEVVSTLTGGVAGLFKKNKIEWIKGHGRFRPSRGNMKVLEVNGDEYEAPNVIIATGSAPVELPFMKFDRESIVDSTGALSFSEVPKHLVVVGGGVIGLELGSVWKRLGARVTVVEFQDRIVPPMDQHLGQELQKSLIQLGIEFKLATKCLGAEKTSKGFAVQLEDRSTGEKSTLECDKILVSVGRAPYTADLGLDQVAVKKDERGRIDIDLHFKTNVDGIYAIGDVVRGPMLAHKAEEEGVVCAEIISGKPGHMNYNLVPSVVYTWPELAMVGATEEELKEDGVDYKSGRFPFAANCRAIAMNEKGGMVKILADSRTGRILGGHVLGPQASNLIGEIVAVMEFGGTAEDLGRICHAHPTLSEAVKEAAMGVDRWQINR